MANDSAGTFPQQRAAIRARLAKNLVLARDSSGLTQEALAKRAGVSRVTVAQIESGQGEPCLSTLVDIAVALGVSPSLLLFGEAEFRSIAVLAEQRLLEGDWMPLSQEDAEKMKGLLRTGMQNDLLSAARIGTDALKAGGIQNLPGLIGAAVGSACLPIAGTLIGGVLGGLMGSLVGGPAARAPGMGEDDTAGTSPAGLATLEGGSSMDQILQSFHNLQEKAKQRELTFLLLGRSGVGKSETINSLFGRKVVQVSSSEPTTLRVKPYDHEIAGISVRIWDTPGLCDDLEEEGNDLRYLEEVRSKITEVDSVWFVSRLDETRVSGDEKRGIKVISEALGKRIWERAVIVFTFADKVDPTEFLQAVQKRSELIRREISKHAGERLVRQIPTIAANNKGTATPDGKLWLPELYCQVLLRVSEQGVMPFLLTTAHRINTKRAQPTAVSSATELGQFVGEEGEFLARQSQSCDAKRGPRTGLADGVPIQDVDWIQLDSRQKRLVRNRVDSSIIPVFANTGLRIGRYLGEWGSLIGGSIGAVVGLVAWLWDSEGE